MRRFIHNLTILALGIAAGIFLLALCSCGSTGTVGRYDDSANSGRKGSWFEWGRAPCPETKP